MNYTETLNYLYQQLPMFTRVGSSAFRKDLTNTIELCNRLDNPQQHFKSIHIGGTNGKGSTSHMLAAILQTADYKTGLYTSPHLKDFRERIRIDGKMISEDLVVEFVKKHKEDFEVIQPSFFEMTVGLAFEAFAQEEVDIAVIEVGLGGRLDSTNIINPLLSVITNIGWDHMNILGHTLPEIASEKAGIIKTQTPVVIGEYQSDIADIFIKKAESENARLRFASEDWDILDSKKVEVDDHQQLLEVSIIAKNDANASANNIILDLTGTYQLKNLKTVLSAVDELRQQGFKISDEHIKTGLRRVKELTGLLGRWHTISSNPLVICDTGHNPEGIREVLLNIKDTPYQLLHFIIGMVNDKDISQILAMLPKDAIYYFTHPDIPRGLPAEELCVQAKSLGLTGKSFDYVQDALSAAKKAAGDKDLIFVGGSTFVVAEVV